MWSGLSDLQLEGTVVSLGLSLFSWPPLHNKDNNPCPVYLTGIIVKVTSSREPSLIAPRLSGSLFSSLLQAPVSFLCHSTFHFALQMTLFLSGL